MPFTRPALTTIVNRIEADIEQRLTGNTPLLQVAFLRILARVFAGAIHVLYGWLAWLADQLFYDTAEDSMLDRHAKLWSLTRKAASFAVGEVTFTGTNGTLVPDKTGLTDSKGIEVETTSSGTITGGSLTLPAEAVLPGNSGNLGATTLLDLVEPIIGITSSQVSTGGFSGGQDPESDAELRSRIFDRISTPPAGGSQADFERWAKEVPGVADVWAYGNTPSSGFVTLVILASGSNPVPSAPILSEVSAYVSTLMPVTTNLVVQAIIAVDIDMTIDLTVQPGADQANVEAAITANLESYFEDVGEPGVAVLISGIRNAISTTGVHDYNITSISKDGSPQSISDISLIGFEYPVLGTITYI